MSRVNFFNRCWLLICWFGYTKVARLTRIHLNMTEIVLKVEIAAFCMYHFYFIICFVWLESSYTSYLKFSRKTSRVSHWRVLEHPGYHIYIFQQMWQCRPRRASAEVFDWFASHWRWGAPYKLSMLLRNYELRCHSIMKTDCKTLFHVSGFMVDLCGAHVTSSSYFRRSLS